MAMSIHPLLRGISGINVKQILKCKYNKHIVKY